MIGKSIAVKCGQNDLLCSSNLGNRSNRNLIKSPRKNPSLTVGVLFLYPNSNT